jgi:hypothetical protein
MYENDLKVFNKLVNSLKNLPITALELKETRIGRGVNSIIKDGIFGDE